MLTIEQRKRLWFVVGLLTGTALLTSLCLYALSESISYFILPSDIIERKIPSGTRVRLGGFVVKNSIRTLKNKKGILFSITDKNHAVDVHYFGILPDLFREEQTVVVEGYVAYEQPILAENILAKHDETYMPKQLVDDLKKRGLWQPTSTPQSLFKE